jgi:hypothetical protein
MPNPELIMNPYIAFVYITATNMVVRLATISFNGIYQAAILFSNVAINILLIAIKTMGFIMKVGINEITTNTRSMNLSLTEKMIIIICLYNLFLLAAWWCQNKVLNEQNIKLESLEKQVSCLKKIERMCEDFDELWMKDFKSFHEETNKKMALMDKKIRKIDKKIKKMDKDMKIYE